MTVAEAEEVTGDLDALTGRRVAALTKLMQAVRLAEEADEELIRCDLAGLAPPAWQKWQQAQAVTKAAEAKLDAPQARLEHLKAELAECRLKAGEVQAVGEHDPLEDRIRARSLKIAFAEEEAAIKQRLGLVQNMMSPLMAEAQEARFAESLAEAEGAVLVEADADPLGHPGATQTRAYRDRMARVFPVILTMAEPGHPDWKGALDALRDVLAASGFGSKIQIDAITAFTEGHPAARAVGTTSKRLPDGSTVIVPPDGPPITYQGRASIGDAVAAPGLPMPDGRDARQVMAEAWGGIQHQQAPGLPGASTR